MRVMAGAFRARGLGPSPIPLTVLSHGWPGLGYHQNVLVSGRYLSTQKVPGYPRGQDPVIRGSVRSYLGSLGTLGYGRVRWLGISLIQEVGDGPALLKGSAMALVFADGFQTLLTSSEADSLVNRTREAGIRLICRSSGLSHIISGDGWDLIVSIYSPAWEALKWDAKRPRD